VDGTWWRVGGTDYDGKTMATGHPYSVLAAGPAGQTSGLCAWRSCMCKRRLMWRWRRWPKLGASDEDYNIGAAESAATGSVTAWPAGSDHWAKRAENRVTILMLSDCFRPGVPSAPLVCRSRWPRRGIAHRQTLKRFVSSSPAMLTSVFLATLWLWSSITRPPWTLRSPYRHRH